MVYSIVTVTFSNWSARGFCRPFDTIQEIIDRFMRSEVLTAEEFDRHEVKLVEFQQLKAFLWRSFELLQQKRATERAAFHLAAQVSHDIRSPLAVLNIALKKSTELSEEKRTVIHDAICRIGEIANNLLLQYKMGQENGAKNATAAKPELIVTIIDSLVAEKRVQFAEKPINLQLEINENTRDCQVKLEVALFKRVLSNLINNAVEALEQKSGAKEVQVMVEKIANMIQIKIADNGKGIAENLLPKIREGGISVGKKDGCGLGISEAAHCIEQWSGNYDIQSVVDVGTVFTIKLPLVNGFH